MLRIGLTLFFATTMLPGVLPADWLQFRGSDHRSVAADARLPLSWSDKEGVAWKTALVGRGASSPIVVKGRVIVTCSSGPKQERLHVVCIDAVRGSQLWERQFWATGRTACHPTSANAAPTPASDGERIFAFYSSNDLVCLDLQGNLLWYRGLGHDYPAVGNDAGMSSSPVVAGDKVAGERVIVQVEAQGESFALALDGATGEDRWRIERKKMANWSSPTVLRGATRADDTVLLQSPWGLTAHDPQDGKERWRHDKGCSGIPSATPSGDMIFVPSSGITALRVKAGSSPELVWQENKLSPAGPSPVVHDGHIYTMNRTILVCGDAATGKVLWQLRLASGMYWATPLVAGNHLYVMSYEGLAQVVKLGEKEPKVIATTQIGEQVQGSPAVAGGAMFLRTDKHLWKIASPTLN
ncbi:MAG: PQQ-binding-like beta-propeller repeat protein [Pirellulales bacterium]